MLTIFNLGNWNNFLHSTVPTSRFNDAFIFDSSHALPYSLQWNAPLRDVPTEWVRLAYGVKTWRITLNTSGYSVNEVFQTGQTTSIDNGVKTVTGNPILNMEGVLRYMENRESPASPTAILSYFEGSFPETLSFSMTPNARVFFSESENTWYQSWSFLVTVVTEDGIEQAAGGILADSFDSYAVARFAGNYMTIGVDSGLSIDLTVNPEEWI